MDNVKLSQKNQMKEIMNRLKPIVAKVLRTSEDELTEDRPLINYGVGSLTSLILVQKINKNFGLQLILEEIFMNQSLNILVQLIYTKLIQIQGDFSENLK